MKKKIAWLLSLVIVMIAALTACGTGGNQDDTQQPDDAVLEDGSTDGTEGDTEPADTSGGLTCLITESPAGVPFTDLTWTGFERIEEEYGVEVKLIEALDKAEYAEQIRAMADMGANPIYTMFDPVSQVTIELAPEYPDTTFCLIDSGMDTVHDNVVNVYVDSLEPAFVAGFIAAKTTEAGHVGWIGNLDIPVINRFRDAYNAGAAYADSSVEVSNAYIGDDSDIVKASETTKIMIDQGVDVIFQSANLAGLGVIQACGEEGVACIGVDEWQGGLDDVVFWSALTDINGAVFDSFTSFRNGDLPSGRIDYGIGTNSAIYDERDYNALPAAVREELDALIEDVKNGSLDLEALILEDN